jgi:UDP-galactopyranose mutase
VFLETIIAVELFTEFIVFMDLEASLLCTQEIAAEFCTIPDEFDPCYPINIRYNQAHYNEYLIKAKL